MPSGMYTVISSAETFDNDSLYTLIPNVTSSFFSTLNGFFVCTNLNSPWFNSANGILGLETVV